MKRIIYIIFTFMILGGMIVTSAIAQTAAETGADRNPPDPQSIGKPTRPEPERLPQEIIDFFAGGITVDEFLTLNKGQMPNAILAYMNLPVVVIVQLEEPSLVTHMSEQPGFPITKMKAEMQQSYVAKLTAFQDGVINQIHSKGIEATIMGRYTKALNGFMTRVPFNDLSKIRSIPGVKSVSRAPEHTVDLSHSVPLIHADDVWYNTGYTGADITIAIIDTGIDYTHAAFGGTGTADAYNQNDPDYIEPGSFPTLKVIGGYDFAGTDYDASDEEHNLPVEDPDPLDEAGHGTHVASIAAGESHTFGYGVAPEASLYAYKVFGKSGTTNLVMDAIERAMDPNQDGNTNDHVDVINMSLGSSFGPARPDDPEFMAIEAASALGIVVVASSGNAGDEYYVTGAPGNNDSAISVASSTTGWVTSPYISYTDNNSVQKDMPYTTSQNPFPSAIGAELVDVSTGGPNALLCDTTDFPNMDTKIALISRGECSFATKINNAEALGAVAAIIYNNAPGIINMNTAGSSLPAGSITQADGEILKSLTNKAIDIGPDTTVMSFVDDVAADKISDFSSRGPRGYDSMLKPEITAPGSNIFAASMGSGNAGESMSGTSMAAPHIAGVAALMKEAHPTWRPEQIKAAMMNTAVVLVDDESVPYDVPRQGAGRVDALAAVETEVIAVGDSNFVSLNWGLLELGQDIYTISKTVTLYNYGASDVTLDVDVFPTSSFDGATLEPDADSVTVSAGGSATVEFTLTLNVNAIPCGFGDMEEYFGYVTFMDAGNTLLLPFYFVPRPFTEITADGGITTFEPDSFGYVDFTQTGQIASNLWAYPVFIVSENDPAVDNMADLRYVGMDAWYDSLVDDMLIDVGFNMYAPQHTNQPYWSEIDLWVYGDEEYPVVNFNYNFGAATGSYPDNQWVILQIDFNDGGVYLASPYAIHADYNSGFQEWFFPAGWNHVSDRFSYDVVSYDWYGNWKLAGSSQFDISRPPLAYVILDETWENALLTPHNEKFSLLFQVNDLDGFFYSYPKGIMLVDYNGQPGIGQAYFYSFEVNVKQFLPLILR